MSIINDLRWRHAVKAYDKDKKVSKEVLHQIIEAMSLAPTSSGLQPFEIFVLESEEVKRKIADTCFLNNAEYVMNSTYTILVAGWDNYTEERINKMYNHITHERGLPEGRYNDYVSSLIEKYVHNASEQENFAHIARQAYIAIGMGLTEAACLHIATTPMEGFYFEQADKHLGLREKGLKSLCLIAVGYADEKNDWNR